MVNLCKTFLLSCGVLTAMASGAHAQVRGKTDPYTCGITANGKTTAWQKITAVKQLKLLPISGKAKLPTAYAVYTIPEKQLKDFLMAAKKAPDYSVQISLPLSANEDCKHFQLANANTMDPVLAAKYPELVSLKGQSTASRNAALRLDYDGSDLRAEITWEGTVYLLSPWKSGKKKYYLVYKKEDAGIERKHNFKG